MAKVRLVPDVESAAAAVTTARQRHNALIKHHGPGHPKVTAAELVLREAKLAEHVRQAVAAAPPLPADAIDRIRRLLPPSRAEDRGAGAA